METSSLNVRCVVRPEESGAVLENPAMGWVLHYYDNGLDAYGARLSPSDSLEDFPGITVIYLRLAWGYLEPEEGQYHWELIDTPAQRWISRGKQIAFRFTCSEWGEKDRATPAWVEEAGAKGYRYTPGKGVDPEGAHWEPDYNDPIFLEKHERFLRAVAARYDGAPELAFIDVGSFGIWGENHNFWSTKLDYDAETVKRHLDLYARVFHHTLLVYNTAAVDHQRGEDSLKYARTLGMTFRDDSILVLGEELSPQRWARASSFWPYVPVVLESQHYGMSVQDGYWGDGSGYLQAVEDYHASYVSIHWWPREFLHENCELVQRIGLRMGYRVRLVEASWPEQVRQGEHWLVETHWLNTGVAPCYPGGFLTVTLKDEKGGIAGVFVDDTFNAAQLPINDDCVYQHQHTFRLPDRLVLGTYELFVSIGARSGTPRIALPLLHDDSQRRYRAGTISVGAADL